MPLRAHLRKVTFWVVLTLFIAGVFAGVTLVIVKFGCGRSVDFGVVSGAYGIGAFFAALLIAAAVYDDTNATCDPKSGCTQGHRPDIPTPNERCPTESGSTEIDLRIQVK